LQTTEKQLNGSAPDYSKHEVRLWVQIQGSGTFVLKSFEIIVAWHSTHIYLDEIKQPSIVCELGC